MFNQNNNTVTELRASAGTNLLEMNRQQSEIIWSSG